MQVSNNMDIRKGLRGRSSNTNRNKKIIFHQQNAPFDGEKLPGICKIFYWDSLSYEPETRKQKQNILDHLSAGQQ